MFGVSLSYVFDELLYIYMYDKLFLNILIFKKKKKKKCNGIKINSILFKF